MEQSSLHSSLHSFLFRSISAQTRARIIGFTPVLVATTFMASPSSAAQPATAAIAASTTDSIPIIAVGSRVVTYRRVEGREDCHT